MKILKEFCLNFQWFRGKKSHEFINTPKKIRKVGITQKIISFEKSFQKFVKNKLDYAYQSSFFIRVKRFRGNDGF